MILFFSEIIIWIKKFYIILILHNTNYNTSQFQSGMSNLSPEHDDSDKSIRNNLVKDIARLLVNSKMNNGGRVPHVVLCCILSC